MLTPMTTIEDRIRQALEVNGLVPYAVVAVPILLYLIARVFADVGDRIVAKLNATVSELESTRRELESIRKSLDKSVDEIARKILRH
jgi:hypothetical protein